MHEIAQFVLSLGPPFTFGSFLVAYLLYREHRRRTLVDLLMRIHDRLETDERRKLRKSIYGLNREDLKKDKNENAEQLDDWGAELDYAASLFGGESKRNLRCFFFLYGDVFLRSIYIMAPYVNGQRPERGMQFLLPTSRFARKLLDCWKAESKRGFFPTTIRWKQTKLRLNQHDFQNDEECHNFLR
jgi:hypothetical protein